MPRGNMSQSVTNGVPYHLWQNAMRMSIEQYKFNCKKVKAKDLSKRNWLIFKLRRKGMPIKEIGEIVGLSRGGVQQIEIKCCKAILKNIKKLKQRSQKHGRI
jgi:DNA-directed RNA polymerase specialized sigma subunit